MTDTSQLSSAIKQLRQRTGLMAELGRENGAPKLDWVEGLARLLADDAAVELVESEAQEILERGIRHVIWAGMGGSIGAVRALVDLGLFSPGPGSVAIYPLDSTDPAALNRIVEKLARAKGLDRPSPHSTPPVPWLRDLLGDVLMIGVAMGMTSEEPITHLEWFSGLLETSRLTAGEHLLVMALPNSFLDLFARSHGVPILSLQLDGGTGTSGRMSAPSTRVFLLPAALALASRGDDKGRLRTALRQAWEWHDLDGAEENPDLHPFVRLAGALNEASRNGVVRLLLDLPERWTALLPWIEQLMEESLGKSGKGVVVFNQQPLNPKGLFYDPGGSVHITVTSSLDAVGDLTLALPYLEVRTPDDLLAASAASFLGWQLTMALVGYRLRIVFAGQPAVEEYKSRTRILREQESPLHTVLQFSHASDAGLLTLLSPPTSPAPESSAAGLFAACLQATSHLDYVDCTYNGELPTGWDSTLRQRLALLANDRLGIPFKLRRAPAAYHSTEQSEMDGPDAFVSLRLICRRRQPSLLGSYPDRLLEAQTVATWQAMVEAGRRCFLLILDGAPEEAFAALDDFLQSVCEQL